MSPNRGQGRRLPIEAARLLLWMAEHMTHNKEEERKKSMTLGSQNNSPDLLESQCGILCTNALGAILSRCSCVKYWRW